MTGHLSLVERVYKRNGFVVLGSLGTWKRAKVVGGSYNDLSLKVCSRLTKSMGAHTFFSDFL